MYSETEMPNFASILDTYGVSLTTGPIADNDARHYYNMGGPLYLLPNVNSSSYTGSLSGGYVYLPISLGINYPQNSTTDDTESTEESKTRILLYWILPMMRLQRTIQTVCRIMDTKTETTRDRLVSDWR